jgi:hypothetical protein
VRLSGSVIGATPVNQFNVAGVAPVLSMLSVFAVTVAPAARPPRPSPDPAWPSVIWTWGVNVAPGVSEDGATMVNVAGTVDVELVTEFEHVSASEGEEYCCVEGVAAAPAPAGAPSATASPMAAAKIPRPPAAVFSFLNTVILSLSPEGARSFSRGPPSVTL